LIPPDRNPADVPECRCADVRRIRELNENNTKKFIEERKRQAVMQSRQMELLRKLHTDHADKLRLEMNSVRRQIWGGGLGPQQERPSGASAMQENLLATGTPAPDPAGGAYFQRSLRSRSSWGGGWLLPPQEPKPRPCP